MVKTRQWVSGAALPFWLNATRRSWICSKVLCTHRCASRRGRFPDRLRPNPVCRSDGMGWPPVQCGMNSPFQSGLDLFDSGQVVEKESSVHLRWRTAISQLGRHQDHRLRPAGCTASPYRLFGFNAVRLAMTRSSAGSVTMRQTRPRLNSSGRTAR